MFAGPSSPVGTDRATVHAERRVYDGTNDRTVGGSRHVTLSPVSRIAGFLLVAGLIGWSGFATLAYFGHTLGADSTEARVEIDRAAYEARLAGLAAREQQLEQALAEADRRRDRVTERLGDKQARLVETRARLNETEAELAALRRRVAEQTAGRHEDGTRIARLEAELAARTDALAGAETERANLDTAFERYTGAMNQVIDERDSARDGAEELRAEVTRLAGDLGQLKDRQTRLIARVEDAARTTFTGLESMFAGSDLDLERILAQARREHGGAGGPYRPLDGATEAAVSAGDTRVAALMRELETVDLMRYAARRLPFGQPVEEARLTSDFGPRNDPHGRGHAIHEGIDYAAPRGTAIHATAEGIVTFAGRQRGYGIIVEIRHAFGFETVYAHLDRARVKAGQRVARGDRIGDMGSTGRSTGTHVHYEIRIDKKPVNPLKFIEAARDVL